MVGPSIYSAHSHARIRRTQWHGVYPFLNMPFHLPNVYTHSSEAVPKMLFRLRRFSVHFENSPKNQNGFHANQMNRILTNTDILRKIITEGFLQLFSITVGWHTLSARFVLLFDVDFGLAPKFDVNIKLFVVVL